MLKSGKLEKESQISVVVIAVIDSTSRMTIMCKSRPHLFSALAIWQFFLNDLASPSSFYHYNIMPFFPLNLTAGKQKEHYFCLTYS